MRGCFRYLSTHSWIEVSFGFDWHPPSSARTARGILAPTLQRGWQRMQMVLSVPRERRFRVVVEIEVGPVRRFLKYE